MTSSTTAENASTTTSPPSPSACAPLRSRLEKQGLLISEWNTEESRPRKFYRVSPEGARVRTGLLREWQDLGASISRLTKGVR
ncbi:hypothetical protein DDE74_35350 [Streptomyces lydicus]|uniref:Uncharacterized protein n=1 Tax=Streptomyces lydicus TaxID=47763 RepID=A0A3Q9KEE6_9ACTN|nr:hypothetical protein DDE74_35350 [Streptomyces lydicus]